MQDNKVDLIVLAGRREGRVEPFAATFNMTEKCLVPIAGQPLIEHVLAPLLCSPLVGRVLVSINDPGLLISLPHLQNHLKAGKLLVLPSKGNLADSVCDAAVELRFPLVVTTGDNVLFTAEALHHFVSTAKNQNADAAAAFARREDVLAVHAEGQRRFYELADGSYSNCNCYWIGNERALDAAEVFRSGGQFRKHPMRIAQMFGLLNLVKLRFGLLSLFSAFGRISKRLDLRVIPVIFEDGALAIDVDNKRSHEIAEAILLSRMDKKAAA
jgi:GTP:adenosylcobinamide-phosphate guanylyltransferase